MVWVGYLWSRMGSRCYVDRLQSSAIVFLCRLCLICVGSSNLVLDQFSIFGYFVHHQHLWLFKDFMLHQLNVKLKHQPFVKSCEVYFLISMYVYSRLFGGGIIVPSKFDMVVVLGYWEFIC